MTLRAADAQFDQARRALVGLTAPRLAFRQFYDGFLAELAQTGDDGPPLPKSFMHAIFRAQSDLSPSTLADPETVLDAAALALVALTTPERMAHAAASALAAGLFDTPGQIASQSGKHRKALAGEMRKVFGPKSFRARLERASLQQYTSPEATFTDPARLLPAILLARQRLCRVESIDEDDKPVVGSGFLVGPSVVLTNWHVVQHAKAGTPPRVVFDYGHSSGLPTADSSVISVRDDWCIAKSPPGALEPASATDGWWASQADRAGWRAALGDALDFALLRLEGAPGLQRGWYDLALTARAGLHGACFVLHHPNGQGHTLTAGEFCLHDALTPASRVFHTASTAQGSSGGLVLNTDGEPVALHYLGLGPNPFTTKPQPRAPDEVVNVAVPLAAIHAHLARNGGAALSAVNELDRRLLVRGCLEGGHPVFGRDRLLETLPEMERGIKQVLWVRPPTSSFERPGKSFTVQILEALMPAPDNIYVKISADQVEPGAKAMAALILRALSATAAAELPEPATSESAYEQVLVEHLREVIADRWPKRRIWLVIDDLDVHDLTDAGGRQFLNTLYSRVGDIPQLRIVLVGLKVNLDSIPRPALVEDAISDMELSDMSGLFKAWLQLRGGAQQPLPEGVVTLVAAALASYAGSKAPLETLSDFTVKHLSAPLKAYFGA